MKLVIISDTHGRHDDVELPEGDILIHCGDVSSRGTKSEIVDFLNWFSLQTHKHKIFIAGNHDFFFEKESEDTIASTIPSNVIYLNDSGCTIKGLNIWGSPVQPEFLNWAFNRKPGNDIKKHWDLIPDNTDILITHGPPYEIFDKTKRGSNVGCDELRKTVFRIKPKIHAFGHIHEGYGYYTDKEITFVNASLLNHKYYYTNDPVIIELDLNIDF